MNLYVYDVDVVVKVKVEVWADNQPQADTQLPNTLDRELCEATILKFDVNDVTEL